MFKVVEMFSGIGSQAKALERLGADFEIVNTVEWDIAAFYAYDIIHNGPQDLSCYADLSKAELLRILSKYCLSGDGKTPVSSNFLRTWPEDSLRKVLCAYNRTRNLGSITQVSGVKLPNHIDLLTYSFPCQDLSLCGAWHGNFSGIDRNAHNRSGMLWEVERILKERHEAKKRLPHFLLMENVKNILSKAHKDNFEEWKSFLSDLGYINQVYTLNASNFGSPQKRVRTYMISVWCPDKNQRDVTTAYFEKNNLEKRKPMARKHLRTCLRTDYSIEKYKREADISNMNDTPSRRRILNENEIVFDGTHYTADTVNTLTTKQDRNPTAGLVMYPEHARGKSVYRNFTPRECFLMMGFDEKDYDALIQNDLLIRKGRFLYSRERCEKLAGNSIVVEVLMAIFRQILELNNLLWCPTSRQAYGIKRRYSMRKKSKSRRIRENG